jgi:hypothetical protein
MAVLSSCDIPEDSGDGGMGQLLGPGHVDQAIRQAVQVCWMTLPKDKRNIDEVERQIRRLVDRALKDLREDNEAFWKPDGS